MSAIIVAALLTALERDVVATFEVHLSRVSVFVPSMR